MSIETFPSTESEPKKVPTEQELQTIVNGPAETGELATEAPATPQSRIANLLSRGLSYGSNLALETSIKLENAADKQHARAEQSSAYATYAENIDTTKSRERGEKIDNVKETLRAFGHNALKLPRRGYLEARVQLNVGRQVAGEKIDAVKDTAANVAGVVAGKAGEVAATVQNGIENKKNQVKSEAMTTIMDIASLVEQGVNTYNKYKPGVEDAIQTTYAKAVAEYGQVRDLIGNTMRDKANTVRDFFAERKQAALDRKKARKSAAAERKQTRTEARDGRRADRAKTGEINRRVVNVESMKRMDARQERIQSNTEKAEARRRGRAAMATAFRVGVATGKETYAALK